MNHYFSPFPELITDRMQLRKITDNDATDLLAILGDPQVAQYEYFYPLATREEALAFIRRYQRELAEGMEITWGLADKVTGKIIGTCCLGNISQGSRRAEIGYNVARAHWKKGYATEAIRAVVDFGFTKLNLNRIEATITPGNDASVKVLKKLGFLQEGLLRERDLIKGKLEDGIMMALLQRDWMQ